MAMCQLEVRECSVPTANLNNFGSAKDKLSRDTHRGQPCII